MRENLKEMIYDRASEEGKEDMQIKMEVGAYKEEGNIKITFFGKVSGKYIPLEDITEDFCIPLKKNQAFLEPGMAYGKNLEFLKKYELGELTGEVGRCGLHECPVFEFDEAKLREFDPEGYQQYEEAYSQRKETPVKAIPDEPAKTLDYHWEYGNESIGLMVEFYCYGGSLCVRMLSHDEYGWDDFDDLTVNLPGYLLDPDMAFISGNSSEDKIAFIKEYQLGEVLARKGYSGMGEYYAVRFDLQKLAEYDRVGMGRYSKRHKAWLKSQSSERSEEQTKESKEGKAEKRDTPKQETGRKR